MGQAVCFPEIRILTPAWFPILYLSKILAYVVPYMVSAVGKQ